MNTEPKHTPLPWTRDANGRIVDSKGKAVRFVDLALACGYVPPGDESRGNTELMFRACNAYEPMLRALEAARPVLEALQAAHPLPDYDSAVGHGKALRLVREAFDTAAGTRAPGR